MGVQVRSVHKRIAVYKQGWAIIILKCQRGHAVYKQGWALVPVRELTEVLLRPQVANSCILVSATVAVCARAVGARARV
jgi:hypothetical protein